MVSRDFKELRVWQKSHQLTLAVYKATRSFPQDELYGLTSQVRRASASVGANIAEGCGRGGDAEFARFLRIAMGTASELEYHLILAGDLAFLNEGARQSLVGDVIELKRMLTAFIKHLKDRSEV